MTQDKARTEAERRFGDVNAISVECEQFGTERNRNANRAEFLSELKQDTTFAIRQLARTRSFTAVVVLTLALGIGATAAVFSALYAVVLRPFPFTNPDRVVVVSHTEKGESSGLSAAEFVELRDHATGFEKIAAGLGQYGYTLTGSDIPELITGGRVTHDYFAVFGIPPLLGHTFDPTADTPGNDHVAVLSYKFWMSHYNGDGGILARNIQLNGEPYAIIGVMPRSFDLGTDADDLWTPLAITPADISGSGAHYLSAFARLKPRMSIAQARDQATTVDRGLATRLATEPSDAINGHAIEIARFGDDFIGDYRALLYILLGAVSFVLLIACTNVANLLLSRGSARAKELAIRAALGAGRGRLVRQLLTESLVLAFTGAVVGLGVAWAIMRGVRSVSPAGIPRLDHASMDWHVLAFTFVLAVACSMLFGLIPALRAAGPSLQTTLRESGRSSGSSQRGNLRGILVAAEVTLAMTLLTGAGLLIRSAWLVQHVDPGFDARGVLTSRIILPEAQYGDASRVTETFARIREEAAQIPGVNFAALGSVVPLSGSRMNSSVRAEGTRREAAPHTANLRLVSPDYFSVMRIPLRGGRDITMRDNGSAPNVVVINEALAHKLWPGAPLGDAIGKRVDAVSMKRDVPELREVVGIVGDLHDAALSKPSDPEVYLPIPQTPPKLWPFLQRSLVVVVRTSDNVDAAGLKKPLQQAVARVDRSLPLADATTMVEYVRTSLETARFNTLLLSTLGAIALALAMVGVYGVVSYFVTQRTQEIGVRMALGASPLQIWRHVVQRGLTPIVAGVGIGFGMSFFTTRVLESQLYGVGTTDPLTFSSVAALLLLVSLLATYVPAKRAMRVAPVVALNA